MENRWFCLQEQDFPNTPSILSSVLLPFFLPGRWDEVIEFPVRYKDIPMSTQIVLTIHDIILPNRKVFVGGTTLPLFGRKGKLKTGSFLFIGSWHQADKN
jgi:phosphatidylinositol 3-kinase